MQTACNKCRVSRPLSGDTWCVGCGAWEVIGQELSGGWQGPGGLKEIANDLVLATARSIRGLRSLGAGLHRAPSAGPPTVPAVVVPPRAPLVGEGGEGGSAPAAASKTAPAAPESEYTYTEGEESVEETRDAKKRSLVDPRPSLPRRGAGASSTERGRAAAGVSPSGESKAPVVKRELSEESRSEERKKRENKRERNASEQRQDKRERKKDKKDRSEKRSGKKKKKRGGRKHQRVHRLAEQPFLQVHRRLSSSFLDERPSLWEEQKSPLLALALQWRRQRLERVRKERLLRLEHRNGQRFHQRLERSWSTRIWD